MARPELDLDRREAAVSRRAGQMPEEEMVEGPMEGESEAMLSEIIDTLTVVQDALTDEQRNLVEKALVLLRQASSVKPPPGEEIAAPPEKVSEAPAL